jgi:methyl-accepting chemotaxis protein
VGIVALSMASQAIVVILAAIAARKTQTRVLQIAEELRARATPIIESAEGLLKETLPKLRTITDNLLDTSKIVKAKAQELDSTITEVNKKTQAQVARIDGMVSTALTATGGLASMIHQGIKTPVLEAIGVVNGFKAGIDVLLSKSKGPGKKPSSIQVYKRD